MSMEMIVNIIMMIVCIEVFIYGFKKGWHSKEGEEKEEKEEKNEKII